ncbi:MAG: class I SAM-dependent methyltransferase [Deltaproteobacteria bacterium]
MTKPSPYFMENAEETIRLEMKTDPEVVRKQARWCGVGTNMRVLDAGCGSGKTTSILHEMIKPGGSLLGVDYSSTHIIYARRKYEKPGIHFELRDLRESLQDLGKFDLIWVRFVIEYNRIEGSRIVRNLTECLKPGGHLCLLDLDHNCLSHYQLPEKIESLFHELTIYMEQKFNFDAYAGRKLYSYLYEMEYEEIKADVAAHHLIYGESKDVDVYNWIKKLEIVTEKASELFEDYPGGHSKFFDDFLQFFKDPKRFTYTPIILCKGRKSYHG